MEQRTVRIAAVMTAPRYENTYCRNYIEMALRKLGIPLTVSGGVYYGQCMQKMLEQLCATDCQYAVTVDGDSMFTADQLQRLLSIIEQEEQIDAITGVQLRRGKLDILGTAHNGETKLEWDGYPLKVRTAHFGLTVIDLAKLRQVPKPWFCATPNENGMWDGNKVDDDVHFWFQWEKAGNSIYMDPGVRIGHLEEMVAVYDADLKPMHVYPCDWVAENVG